MLLCHIMARTHHIACKHVVSCQTHQSQQSLEVSHDLDLHRWCPGLLNPLDDNSHLYLLSESQHLCMTQSITAWILLVVQYPG